MGKLLQTRLPTSIGEISSETFNRLVRVLELSLNTVDVDATLSVNETREFTDVKLNSDTDESMNLVQDIFAEGEEEQLAIEFLEENGLYTKFLLWCGIKDQLKNLKLSLATPTE